MGSKKRIRTKDTPKAGIGQGTRAWSVPDCKHFTGYRPCRPATRCYEACVDPTPIGTRILIINLDAMGNVLVTTSIIEPLKRRYPRSHISWLTLPNSAPLLEHVPGLDRVYRWEPEAWLVLQQLHFDLVLNVDKSRRSGALTGLVSATEKLGFGINRNGVIIPLNREAEENYLMGLDDEWKFRRNTKTVPQILCEQFRLAYRRDPYAVVLSPEEKGFCSSYAREHGLRGSAGVPQPLVVGFNTGCSELYANKKLSIEQHVELIDRLSTLGGTRLLLLGGPEDTLRNAEISRRTDGRVLNTPTTEGVRRGLCYINLCDVVISGDSFGMHAAIGLGKHVIVWFGVSCWTEIDLFDRGLKLIPEGLACSPCWKRECPFNLECRSMVDLDRIVQEVHERGRRKEDVEQIGDPGFGRGGDH